MKKTVVFLLNGAIFLMFLVLTGCTLPTAGTETGNPDISACLSTVFLQLDSVSQWNPAAYLVEGEEQLNPGRVNTLPSSGILLAKQIASDTTLSDTVELKDAAVITTYEDTIVIVDKVISLDTVVIDTVISDTIVTVLDDQGGVSLLINELIRYDTLYISDTTIMLDTFIIQQNEATPGFPASGEGRNINYQIEYSSNDIPKMNYYIERDSATGEVILYEIPTSSETAVAVPASDNRSMKTIIKSDSVFTMVARNYSLGGMVIAENYRDNDGDGFLNTVSNAVGTCRSLGYITYRQGDIETEVKVDFDAGTDNQFATTCDNRIFSLLKIRKTGAEDYDRVLYEPTNFYTENRKTRILSRETVFPDGEFIRKTYRYGCIAGEDSLDHRHTMLASYYVTMQYRHNDPKEIEITFQPSSPLVQGQPFLTGSLQMNIDFGKGIAGIVVGTLDFTNNVISGTYSEAGKEYQFLYNHISQKLDIQVLK